MKYQCPVCGYDQMTHPPEDFYICPSCGTEFENDDFEITYTQLRERWLESGAVWFSRATLKPRNWNPYVQLGTMRFRIYQKWRTKNWNPYVQLGTSQNSAQIKVSTVTKGTSVKTVRLGRSQIMENLEGVRLAHA